MLRDILLHWWAVYGQILVDGSVCPTGPSGQLQTADVALDAARWRSLFTTVLALTVAVALPCVFATYWTQRGGAQFARRWKVGWLLTAVLTGVVAFAVLMTSPLQTVGCQYGEVAVTLPADVALARAVVAFGQSLLVFLFWTLVVTRVARAAKLQPIYNNWYPF